MPIKGTVGRITADGKTQHANAFDMESGYNNSQFTDWFTML